MNRASLLLAAALVLAGGCARRETQAEAGLRTGTLLLGNGAEPQDLDPQICTAYGDYNILIALFEGLTCIDEGTSRAVPGVAERWEASPDGLAYTFHLRADALWSDGDPVTADDFVYSFRRILSPAIASEYSYLLYPIKNAEAFNAGRLTDFAHVGVRGARRRAPCGSPSAGPARTCRRWPPTRPGFPCTGPRSRNSGDPSAAEPPGPARETSSATGRSS